MAFENWIRSKKKQQNFKYVNMWCVYNGIFLSTAHTHTHTHGYVVGRLISYTVRLVSVGRDGSMVGAKYNAK